MHMIIQYTSFICYISWTIMSSYQKAIHSDLVSRSFRYTLKILEALKRIRVFLRTTGIVVCHIKQHVMTISIPYKTGLLRFMPLILNIWPRILVFYWFCAWIRKRRMFGISSLGKNIVDMIHSFTFSPSFSHPKYTSTIIFINLHQKKTKRKISHICVSFNGFLSNEKWTFHVLLMSFKNHSSTL